MEENTNNENTKNENKMNENKKKNFKKNFNKKKRLKKNFAGGENKGNNANQNNSANQNTNNGANNANNSANQNANNGGNQNSNSSQNANANTNNANKKKKIQKRNVSILDKKVEKKTNINRQKPEKSKKSLDETLKDQFFLREDFSYKKSKLKIIPLGGIEEIGKNITVFEYEDEMIIVDCGVSFPEDDMLGIDLVIPDFTYLINNKDKIKGLVVTHGHEDHIGAIAYLLMQINIPIYATRLTIGLIKNKLEEHKLLNIAKLNTVNQGDVVDLGRYFKVEFIRSCHSIPDSVALAIHTPAGVVIHTGDFKIDYTPIDDQKIDLGRLAELGNKGVLALLSDSTNSERKGYTMSESTVGEVFDKLFTNCKKRIVVATFASNMHRVQQIVNSAVANNRKIAVCGRSMIKMIETSVELGYIHAPKNTFIDIDMLKNYNDDQLVIITTGSQGEPMSALTRMANGEHRKVNINSNDLVILSATPIPGNEKFVAKVIDDLMKIGAEVVYSSLADVHVSGHACQEEQKLMLSLVRPKYFIPVHGEYRQLVAHRNTARIMGIPAENIILMKNGKIVEINDDEAKLTGTVTNGSVFVDGLGVGDVGNIVLRDRQHLSQDGLIIVVLTMNKEGAVLAGPDVISRGFVYVRESENLMEDVKMLLHAEIDKCLESGNTDWASIKTAIKDSLKDYIFQKTKRNPMILPVIMEV